MKQLEDGGVAFYADRSHVNKKVTKILIPRLIGVLVGAPLIMLFAHPANHLSLSSLVLYTLILCGGILAVAFVIVVLLRKFVKILPSCTVYDSYIVWKDSQTGILTQERKLFFKDIQGFFIKKETIYLRREFLEENVICFVMKDPKVHAPFYPYYAWLSTQDQQLLIELLKDKKLTFLPGDYQPN